MDLHAGGVWSATMGTAEDAGRAVRQGDEPSVRRGQAPAVRRRARPARPWPSPIRVRFRPRARSSPFEQPSHQRGRGRRTEGTPPAGATDHATRALATLEAGEFARPRRRSTTPAEEAALRFLRARGTARVRTTGTEAGRTTTIDATGAGASRGKARARARAKRRAIEDGPEPRASWAQCF